MRRRGRVVEPAAGSAPPEHGRFSITLTCASTWLAVAGATYQPIQAAGIARRTDRFGQALGPFNYALQRGRALEQNAAIADRARRCRISCTIATTATYSALTNRVVHGDEVTAERA